MSGYASFLEAAYVFTVEDLFDCYEVAQVSNENERRAHMAIERKSKAGRGRSR